MSSAFASVARLPARLVEDGTRRRQDPAWRLFPGQNRANPLSTRQLNRAIHSAADLARIDKRVSMHMLRHSFVPAPAVNKPTLLAERALPTFTCQHCGAPMVITAIFSRNQTVDATRLAPCKCQW